MSVVSPTDTLAAGSAKINAAFAKLAQRLTADAASIAPTVNPGDTVANLIDPFAGLGLGTTGYTTFGSPAGQLALSGTKIVAGSAAPSPGGIYTIGVEATSGDQKQKIGALLTFTTSGIGPLFAMVDNNVQSKILILGLQPNETVTNTSFGTITDSGTSITGTWAANGTVNLTTSTNRNLQIAVTVYSQPALTLTFDQALAATSIPQTEDLTFGASAVTNNGNGAVAITDMVAVSKRFRPLEGEFDINNNYLGGAGYGINNVGMLDNLVADFTFSNGKNFFMDDDGLRIQASLDAGSYSVQTRGQNDTTTGSYFNTAGSTSPVATPIARMGITHAQLLNLGVGDVGNCGFGLFFISAIDTSADTVTLRNLTATQTGNYAGNYQIMLTKLAWCPLAAAVSTGNTNKTLTFLSPIPPQVDVGWALRSYVPGHDRPNTLDGRCRIVSIAADRMSVTTNQPYKAPNSGVDPTGYAGIMFIPYISNGNLWDRGNRGPHIRNRTVVAFDVVMSLPIEPATDMYSERYNKAAYDTWFANAASGAGIPHFGHWAAAPWFYKLRDADGLGNGVNKSGLDPNNVGDEIDNEHFMRFGRGPTIYTIYKHAGPQTHTSIAAPGSNPKAEAPHAPNTSPNTEAFVGTNLYDGNDHRFSGFWDNQNGLVQYIDNQPLASATWKVSPSLLCGLQMGFSNTVGSLDGYYLNQLMFPQNDESASWWFLKIKRIRWWVGGRGVS